MPRGVYTRTPETRQAISDAARVAWQNPERKPRDSSYALKITGRPKGSRGGYTLSANALAHRQRVAHLGSMSSKKQRGKKLHATWPEQVMTAILEHSGVSFEAQKVIGRYVADFYLPDAQAVIEVDGSYWHGKYKTNQATRDQALLDDGVSHVHHVTDIQLLKDMGWN